MPYDDNVHFRAWKTEKESWTEQSQFRGINDLSAYIRKLLFDDALRIKKEKKREGE